MRGKIVGVQVSRRPSARRRQREPSTGDWIRILHAVLRRRARCEAAGESSGAVTTQELVEEVRRFRKATDRLRMPTSGNYV